MDVRLLLRRIALGLPLVALPVGAGVLITSTGCLCGSCPPGEHRSRALTPEEEASLAADTTGNVCYDLCESAVDGGVRDASVGEAGLVDGGRVDRLRNWVCSRGVGRLECQEHIPCGVGRAPSGLVALDRVDAPSRLAAHLAEMAHLERAAVDAFDDLAIELALHGAPSSLVARARQSAREEVSHARIAAQLARSRGAGVPPVERRDHERRSLTAVAEDNAFEGCVREAYGALVAAHQAAHACEPQLRTALGAIARDEARHALLSLDLHDWASRSVTRADARRIEERRLTGLETLAASLATEPDAVLQRDAGLPSATVARDLLGALTDAV